MLLVQVVLERGCVGQVGARGLKVVFTAAGEAVVVLVATVPYPLLYFIFNLSYLFTDLYIRFSIVGVRVSRDSPFFPTASF